MRNEELFKLLKEMAVDERNAPRHYQKIINLVTNKTDKKILQASQKDEWKHYKRIIKLLSKEEKE